MKEILLLLVMFWNLENYFDPFPPNEIKFWSWKKFEKKRDDIAKTIMLAKEQYQCFPALIGVCEVENYFVLKQLTQNTPLHGVEYGIIHKDSPGVVANVTSVLSVCEVNIAFLRVFREKKGGTAFTIIESDEEINENAVTIIKASSAVEDVMCFKR